MGGGGCTRSRARRGSRSCCSGMHENRARNLNSPRACRSMRRDIASRFASGLSATEASVAMDADRSLVASQ